MAAGQAEARDPARHSAKHRPVPSTMTSMIQMLIEQRLRNPDLRHCCLFIYHQFI